MKYPVIIRFQCPADLETDLRKVSELEERTMSQTIRHALRVYIKERT